MRFLLLIVAFLRVCPFLVFLYLRFMIFFIQNDDKINAWRTRLESATARIMPIMCHKMPKSPRAVAAVNNHTVGLKLRVGSSNLSMR